MDQQREKASAIAHEFVVYQESEQSDIKAEEKAFDALWQSIYDVCKLINFGIIDDITQEEFEQGKEQNILLSLVLIKTMSDNKKLALVKMLIEMIKADGKEAPQEMQLFNIIIESTGINKLL